VEDPSFESHNVPAESVIIRPPLPGWQVPLPGNGSYGITNILKSHGDNALYMYAEPDEVYALDHTRFGTIDSSSLVSASISVDVMIGRDFDFDEDNLFVYLVDSAFPDCPGDISDCYEFVGAAEDLRWTTVTMDASHAVTRSDWSGFFLSLLVSEHHYSDHSMGVVDNIRFDICTRGAGLEVQEPRRAGRSDLQALMEAAGDWGRNRGHSYGR
jgi:hypothetical protein